MAETFNGLTDLLWYLSIIIGLGFLVWRAEYAGLDPRETFIAGLFGVIGGLVGGVLMASGGLPPGVSSNPDTWEQFLYAERGVFGVLAGGALFSVCWLVVRGLPIRRYADEAAPAAALAYAIARLDCFAHGHCFGVPTDVPWAVTFAPMTQAFTAQVAAGLISPTATATLPVHPTQLYHAVLGLIGFVVLLRIKNAAPGTRLAVAMVLYGAGRFVIQFFRGDSVPVWGVLDINHMAAIALLVGGVVLWRFRAPAAAVREQPAWV